MTDLRRDRRSKGRDVWGEPGKSYPYGDTSFPQIIEQQTARQSRTLPAFGSAHPDNRYSNLILTDARSSPGDNTDTNWRLKYETIPGPVVSDKPISEIDGSVTVTSRQLVLIASIGTLGESVVSSNTWQKVSQQSHEGSALVAVKVVETHIVPGSYLIDTKLDFDKESVSIYRALVEAATLGAATENYDVMTELWTLNYRERVNGGSVVAFNVTEQRTGRGDPITRIEFRENSDQVTVTEQLLPISSIVISDGIYGGTGDWVRQFRKPYQGSQLVAIQVTEDRVLPGNPSGPSKERDSDGAEVTVVKTLLALPFSTSDSVTSNLWTRITSEPMPDTDVVAWQVVRTRPVNTGHAPTVTGSELDERTGNLTAISKTLVASGTSGSAVGSDGGYTVIEPVNAVVSHAVARYATGASLISGQTWHEFRHVPLPPVLTALNIDAFNDTDGNTIWLGVQHEITDYSAVYDITVTETWKSTPHTGLSATKMIPKAVNFTTPLGAINIPPCLHASLTFSGNTASDGSTYAGNYRYYAYIAWSRTFAATSPASLSGSTITILDTQRPFAGGFLRRTETITV